MTYLNILEIRFNELLHKYNEEYIKIKDKNKYSFNDQIFKDKGIINFANEFERSCCITEDEKIKFYEHYIDKIHIAYANLSKLAEHSLIYSPKSVENFYK